MGGRDASDLRRSWARPSGRSVSRRRPGYTLIELLVVNLLLTLLVVLIAGAWRAFGPLCVEVIARGRIVNEANLAAQAIYQDVNLSPGGLILAQVATPDGTSLQLNYSSDGKPISSGDYPHSVLYSLQTPADAPDSTDRLLVRSDGSTSVTMARHLESAAAVAVTVDPTGAKTRVNYTVTFGYRGSESQYTFAVHN